MIKVGITGGIGSGKTTVAHIFEVLNIPVYYADIEAKKIMNQDENLKQQIILQFGEQSYINGKLNKPYLAAEVFSNKKNTELINNMVHPATITNANNWMNTQTTLYAIKEAALIFEAKAEKHLDLIIGVTAPLNLRIKRVMLRDKLSEQEVLARMQKQMNETEKMNLCDFVINNDENELLIPQVVALHQKIIQNIERLHN
ncbi:MAG: dephospho-CoA kinase [Ferruginibacter sp.]|nr:dephospho-CoA kinase [Ferruginibacter sp.]